MTRKSKAVNSIVGTCLTCEIFIINDFNLCVNSYFFIKFFRYVNRLIGDYDSKCRGRGRGGRRGSYRGRQNRSGMSYMTTRCF